METLSQLPLEDQRKLKERLAMLHEKRTIGLDNIVFYSNNGAAYLFAFCPFENPIDDFWHVVCGKMMFEMGEEKGEYIPCVGFPFFFKSPISGVDIPQFVKGRLAVLELVEKTKLFDFSFADYIERSRELCSDFRL